MARIPPQGNSRGIGSIAGASSGRADAKGPNPPRPTPSQRQAPPVAFGHRDNVGLVSTIADPANTPGKGVWNRSNMRGLNGEDLSVSGMKRELRTGGLAEYVRPDVLHDVPNTDRRLMGSAAVTLETQSTDTDEPTGNSGSSRLPSPAK